jgi:hypothetical protein
MNRQIGRRTEKELEEAAESQFRALQVSARAFDDGLVGEAARLANTIFILVGRGMKGHVSIMDAAKQQERRLYRSTVTAAGALGTPLIRCVLKCVGQNAWEIGLKHAGREALIEGRDLCFDDWWSELVVNNDKAKLSRRDVIRILRDKNGGAHFDAQVADELTSEALRGNIGAFNFDNSEMQQIEAVPHGLEYCKGQIATELWFSFEEARHPVGKSANVSDG